MTKREEIREGIRDIIESFCDWDSEATYQHFENEILSYLHSKGVVILGGLPKSGKRIFYAVEPLVEEGK